MVENEYSRISGSCRKDFLDRKIERKEILACIKKIKNNKTGGSDGLVGELLSMVGWAWYIC